MKKSFTQKFKASPVVHYELLVQHDVHKTFLLFRSTEQHEEEFHRTLNFDAESGRQFSLSLAAYLYDEGLVLNRYRELARQTVVSFSFTDRTPGSEVTEACLLVSVDVQENAKLGDKDEKAVFVTLDEVLPAIAASPYLPPTVVLGVAQLKAETREAGKFLP